MRAKSSKKDESVAFYSNDSEKGRKGGSSSRKDRSIECFNCHKKGHKKPDCWAKGGGKEGQGPNQKGKTETKEKGKETAAAAKDKAEKKVDNNEEAWMALIDSDSDEEGRGDSCFDSNFVDDLFEDNQSDSSSWFTESEELTEEIDDDDLPSLYSVSDSDDERGSSDDDDLLVCESPLIPLYKEANK